MTKNEEEKLESMVNIYNNPKSQELVPSMGPRTVVMLEAGCTSWEYYQALIADYRALRGQNGK